jgi:hypothetical protein
MALCLINEAQGQLSPEQLERGPLSLVRIIEELLESKIAAPV